MPEPASRWALSQRACPPLSISSPMVRRASGKPGSVERAARRSRSSSTTWRTGRPIPVQGSIQTASTPSLAALNRFQAYSSRESSLGQVPGAW